MSNLPAEARRFNRATEKLLRPEPPTVTLTPSDGMLWFSAQAQRVMGVKPNDHIEFFLAGKETFIVISDHANGYRILDNSSAESPNLRCYATIPVHAVFMEMKLPNIKQTFYLQKREDYELAGNPFYELVLKPKTGK